MNPTVVDSKAKSKAAAAAAAAEATYYYDDDGDGERMLSAPGPVTGCAPVSALRSKEAIRV